MCGRYFFTLRDDRAFDRLRTKIEEQVLFEYANDEVFPTQQVLVLLPNRADYSVNVMQWGIEGYQNRRLINARSETIAQKKAFSSMLHHRCLIPCNGFYEWVKQGNRKAKIYIQREDTPLFYLAGIYNEEQQFVIVTGESQHGMKNIHDRTPIIVQEEDIQSYLEEKLPFTVDNTHLKFENMDKEVGQQMNLFELEEEGGHKT